MEKQGQDGATPEKDPAYFRRELLARAHETTTSPGCYLMRDEEGVILYVGKAKNLRARVSSYFQPAVHEVGRTELLVQRARAFDVILTETEAEALILECTLIKKHKPKFNVRLKDDKSYPYLKLDLSQDAPRIEWTRRVRRDGARYFGPFPSAYAARQVMGLLNETFQLRDCSDNTYRHRSRPCILHQMGKCSAPCVGLIAREDYHSTLRDAIAVLEGKGGRLVETLRRSMERAAGEERFEEAGLYRDQLRALEIVTATQGVSDAGAQDPVRRNRDAVAIAREEGGSAHAVVLQIRGGRLIAARHFTLHNTDGSMGNPELLSDFLAQYYLDTERTSSSEIESEPGFEGDGSPPREVLIEWALPESTLLERTLGLTLRVPGGAEHAEESDPSAASDRQLLNVAIANAKHGLELAKKQATGHGVASLEEVQAKLQLSRLPTRIECYDISNTQGEEPVASRVVFIDGAPDKNLYRRYQIKTVVGSNDFAMMREVLGRRFARSEEDLPDLVVVDGGKGQLSQAVAILAELDVQGVAVVGLAKARTERDFRSKEVKSTLERIFIPGRKNPVSLYPSTKAYQLLVHVRDEAHRFAVSYHRLLRSKRSLKSSE